MVSREGRFRLPGSARPRRPLVFIVGWALGGLDVAAAATIIFVLAGVVLRIVTWDWRLWRD